MSQKNKIKQALSLKNKTLRFKVCFWFLLTIAIILIFIWIFQAVFFEKIYEKRNKKNIAEQGNYCYNLYLGLDDPNEYNSKTIAVTFDNIQTAIIKYTYSDDSKVYSFVNEEIQGLDLEKVGEVLNSKLLNTGNEIVTYSQSDLPDLYLYSKQLPNNQYLIVVTRIEPITSTSTIIKDQLFIITAFALIVGLIVSLFASEKISKPLVDLQKQAENFGEGNYDIEFKGKGYKEVINLASTLTSAEGKLKESDELKKGVVANVSHDLRTPLTIIKSYAEMIKDLYGNNDEKRNESLDIIISETDRLSDLVNDVLTLSKLESGTLALELKKINLSHTLEECLTKFDVRQKKDGYKIYCVIDADIMVKADEKKMNAVFYNLIGNALNYSGDEKTVFVSLNKEVDKAIFKVNNTGRSLSKEEQAKIWDQYYRGEKNHQRAIIGTGLGLSIVKSVFELHKLNYGVESKDNNGTAFWFEIDLLDDED